MNLLGDEGLDGRIVRHLRSRGHDVSWVREMTRGIPDTQVIEEARKSGRMLPTEDKDFGELVFLKQLPHCGVALVRLDGVHGGRKGEIVAKALDSFASEMKDAFSVISERQVRIRLPPGSQHS